MAFFLVALAHGPAWDERRSRRSQAGWSEHAAFLDELHREGTIVLGGPLGTDLDSGPALMLVQAADAGRAVAALAADPWHDSVLRIERVELWTLWLEPPDSWPRR